ncbi:MAG: transcriptional repressor [Proteobacteria bacterium]|nr:transcriptional repressor [Pseudomonadota bacterium]
MRRATAALREAGFKLTPQRLAIVRCLARDPGHPSAQRLYERLRREFPSMAFATVYNTLATLVSLGQCRQLSLAGASRFDPNPVPHDHAQCDRCGIIYDVARPAAVGEPAAGELASVLAHFTVDRVETIYRGLCQRCGEATPTTEKSTCSSPNSGCPILGDNDTVNTTGQGEP